MNELNGLLNILGNTGTLHSIRCPDCNPANCACENQQYVEGLELVAEDHRELKDALLARLGDCTCGLCSWVRDQAAHAGETAA